jgi:hypothetical protein
MRVLVTTTGSAGHFGPLVPFVEALLAADARSLPTVDTAVDILRDLVAAQGA